MSLPVIRSVLFAKTCEKAVIRAKCTRVTKNGLKSDGKMCECNTAAAAPVFLHSQIYSATPRHLAVLFGSAGCPYCGKCESSGLFRYESFSDLLVDNEGLKPFYLNGFLGIDGQSNSVNSFN